MCTLILFVNGSEICRMSQAHLPFLTPAKSGDRRWKIVVAGSEHQVLDSYTPSRVKKPTPITRYEGSWAHSMQMRREGKPSS